MGELKVKVEDTLVGEIAKEEGEYLFAYQTGKSEAFISLIMPVRKKDYVHRSLHPIFEMHLPEGYLLSIIKKHFSKIKKMDDFGLLSVMAPFIKGRVTYDLYHDSNMEKLTLDALLHPKGDGLFDELVSRFALRSSLSGVQPKVLASVVNKATLQCDDYIIKSWGEEYPQLALNEYYCMMAVAGAGVKVPEFHISDDEKLFIMKRFDKKEDGSYSGFEDMCVLMGKQRDDKYDGSYEQIAKTIKTFTSKQYKKASLIAYFKLVVLNNLLQNGDAHLKNFGLVYEDIDDIQLAPAYDVVCTTAYIEGDIPALNLLGSKKWWDEKYLLKFGVMHCELTNKEATEAYKTCKESVLKVHEEISKRLQKEKDKEKREVLEKLDEVFS